MSLIIGPFQSFILEFIVRYALLVILYLKEKKSRDCLVMLNWYHFNAFDMARPGRTHDISPPKRTLLPLSYRDLSPPLSLICCLPPNNFLFSQHSRCYSDTCTMLIQVTRCIPSGHVRVLQYRRLPQSVIFDITVLFM